MSSKEYRYIVRILGKDVDGSRKLVVALSQLRGLSFNFAQVLLNTLKIDPNLRAGFLSESEVNVLENGIRNPEGIGIPKWFLNRRREVDTGMTTHLISTALDVAVHNDIEREKGVLSYRGFRHMMGLKVRGQCTRTTGRKGGAVAVLKTGKLLPKGTPSEAADAATTAAPAGKEATPAKGVTPTAESKQTAGSAKDVPKTKEGSKST